METHNKDKKRRGFHGALAPTATPGRSSSSQLPKTLDFTGVSEVFDFENVQPALGYTIHTKIIGLEHLNEFVVALNS